MKVKQLFRLASVLIVLGIALMLIPTPGEPDLQCVEGASQASAFVDEGQDGCRISAESHAAHQEWESGPKADNVVGLLLVLGGLGLIVLGVKLRRRRPRRRRR